MILIIMVIYSAIITIYAEPQMYWVGIVSVLLKLACVVANV